MSDSVQRVVVTGRRIRDDVTLVVGGRAWGGWKDVRITRGIERLPSDFELHLTERFPDAAALFVNPGDPCVVMIGADPVVTGYVDRVISAFDARQHSVTVTGRSKCQDLVDCAAEVPGGQIKGESVLEVARQLAMPYGIKVDGDPGLQVHQFNLMLGETPFEILERLCRFSQLLVYDMPDGNLRLSAARKDDRAGSGFVEGINVQRASALRSMDQQFSEYRAYMQSVARLEDTGSGSDLLASFAHPGVNRRRLRVIVAEASGGIGKEVAKDRAAWEAVRRWARSAVVNLTTDSWRDVAGRLYSPNTLARVHVPTLKVNDKLWTIGEVTYRSSGEAGTVCDVTMMAPDGFLQQPTLLQPLPLDVLELPANLSVP